MENLPLPEIDMNQPISDAIQNIDLSSYAEILNPTAWSTATVESFIVMFLIVVICYKMFHKAYKFAMWCIGALFAVQIFYYFGFTELNNVFPFHEIFKYDVGVSIANFFPGTKLAEWILWIHDLVKIAAIYSGNFIAEWGSKIFNFIDTNIKSMPLPDPSEITTPLDDLKQLR